MSAVTVRPLRTGSIRSLSAAALASEVAYRPRGGTRSEARAPSTDGGRRGYADETPVGNALGEKESSGKHKGRRAARGRRGGKRPRRGDGQVTGTGRGDQGAHTRTQDEPPRHRAERRPSKALVIRAPAHVPARAARDTDGYLIDACDAADLIARASDLWDVASVLAHPEIARAALTEAQARIRAELSRTPNHWFSSRVHKARHARLRAELDELRHASKLLGQAQNSGLVRP